jgi:hypothetical protein
MLLVGYILIPFFGCKLAPSPRYMIFVALISDKTHILFPFFLAWNMNLNYLITCLHSSYHF